MSNRDHPVIRGLERLAARVVRGQPWRPDPDRYTPDEVARWWGGRLWENPRLSEAAHRNRKDRNCESEEREHDGRTDE